MDSSFLTFHILLTATLFYICRLENQRWVRVRSRGIRGANLLADMSIDWTYPLSLLFSWAFLKVYGIEFGTTSAVALLTTVLIFCLTYSGILTLLMQRKYCCLDAWDHWVWSMGFWHPRKCSGSDHQP